MIELKDIEKLAILARIAVSPEEAETLRKDIEGILAYVGQIKGVPGSDEVDVHNPDSVHNVMREDGEPHVRGSFTEPLLSSAPEREGQYVKVKKIL